jgi:AcrR family transcriptional regulator
MNGMKPEETVRRKEKGTRTKRKLFDCAAKLFQEYDFTQVSVEQIVEAAGVAKGTFYIYFPSKDALIAEFISDCVDRVDADYRRVLQSAAPDTPAAQLMLGLIEKIADTLTDKIGCDSMRTVYKLLLEQTPGMGVVKGYGRDLYASFAELLTEGMRRGEFKSELPPETLARHFVLAMRGLSYEWCIRYPDFDLKAEALIHFRLLLPSIRSDL